MCSYSGDNVEGTAVPRSRTNDSRPRWLVRALIKYAQRLQLSVRRSTLELVEVRTLAPESSPSGSDTASQAFELHRLCTLSLENVALAALTGHGTRTRGNGAAGGAAMHDSTAAPPAPAIRRSLSTQRSSGGLQLLHLGVDVSGVVFNVAHGDEGLPAPAHTASLVASPRADAGQGTEPDAGRFAGTDVLTLPAAHLGVVVDEHSIQGATWQMTQTLLLRLSPASVAAGFHVVNKLNRGVRLQRQRQRARPSPAPSSSPSARQPTGTRTPEQDRVELFTASAAVAPRDVSLAIRHLRLEYSWPSTRVVRAPLGTPGPAVRAGGSQPAGSATATPAVPGGAEMVSIETSIQASFTSGRRAVGSALGVASNEPPRPRTPPVAAFAAAPVTPGGDQDAVLTRRRCTLDVRFNSNEICYLSAAAASHSLLAADSIKVRLPGVPGCACCWRVAWSLVTAPPAYMVCAASPDFVVCRRK